MDFSHVIPRTPVISDRSNFLVDRCAGKRVAHIGCVDSGLLSMRLETARLLHTRMLAVARVVGFDVDKIGLDQMAVAGIGNIFDLDVGADADRAIGLIEECLGSCDLIICGEVLEHVTDMGRFLLGVRKIADAFGSEVIFTVPNAHSLRGFLALLSGKENVHPDHNCYFSWATIEILLRKIDYGNIDRKYYIADLPTSALKRALVLLFQKVIYPMFPQFADGIVVVCKSGALRCA